MLPHGSSLDVLPVSQFCGRAAVVDVSFLPPSGIITADFLRGLNGAVLSTDFVLFYTGWEKKWGTDAYFEDTFPVPDKEAAQYLVSCGLKGVGTDALSVDTLIDPDRKAHKTLLGGGLVIVESLCLKKVVGRKDMMFFALPMKTLKKAVLDHRNGCFLAGCIITGILLALILLGAVWTPYDPTAMMTGPKLDGPSFAHLFGTDNFGRDIFSRVLKGAGVTALVAVGTVVIGAVCGTLIGALTGYFGGAVDELLMMFPSCTII